MYRLLFRKGNAQLLCKADNILFSQEKILFGNITDVHQILYRQLPKAARKKNNMHSGTLQGRKQLQNGKRELRRNHLKIINHQIKRGFLRRLCMHQRPVFMI